LLIPNGRDLANSGDKAANELVACVPIRVNMDGLDGFTALFLATTVLTMWGMLTRNPNVPAWVHRHDKVMHFLAFAVLAGLARGAWPTQSLLLLWTCVTGLGLVAEVMQNLTSHRQFSWGDGLANALGAAVMLLALHQWAGQG